MDWTEAANLAGAVLTLIAVLFIICGISITHEPPPDP